MTHVDLVYASDCEEFFYNDGDINASDALCYHNTVMRNKNVECQVVSVEKKNPYSNQWEDESHVIGLQA